MGPTSPSTKSGVSLKGMGGLLIAIGVIVAVLIAWPAYRRFFMVSLGIGLGVAAGLSLWHRLRPIREEDVENKKPLGLG
jgi:UDP-N-acetylmuramyl pentapeptide phosphotransferase/UDP-N-acetylglucosamine-1-phosphate transferase